MKAGRETGAGRFASRLRRINAFEKAVFTLNVEAAFVFQDTGVFLRFRQKRTVEHTSALIRHTHADLGREGS
jgi:hypothetical protein